jgi:hypothetical protein
MVKGSEAPVYGTLQSSFSSVFCFVPRFLLFPQAYPEQDQAKCLKEHIFRDGPEGPVRFSSDFRDRQMKSVREQEGKALW